MGDSVQQRAELALPAEWSHWIEDLPARDPRIQNPLLVVSQCAEDLEIQINDYFEHHLSKQLSCLSKFSNPSVQASLFGLKRILARVPTVSVKCLRSGETRLTGVPMGRFFRAAASCHARDKNFPSIDINLDHFGPDQKDLLHFQGMMLHEVMHWSGNTHYSTLTDLAYLGGICCGDEGGVKLPIPAHLRQEACRLIETPSSEWEQSQNQLRFADLLAQFRVPTEVVQQTLWSAWVKQLKLDSRRAVTEGVSLLMRLAELDPQNAPFFYGLIGVKATKAPGPLPRIWTAKQFLGSLARGDLLRTFGGTARVASPEKQDWLATERNQDLHLLCSEAALTIKDLEDYLSPIESAGASQLKGGREFLKLRCLGPGSTRY